MRVAFFAPMKAPDHPVPSGDRAMARALLAALAAGGHAVDIASGLRTWCPSPDPEAMRRVEVAADDEARRLADAWSAENRPDLWFTYHSYYRAPDLLGPRVAARLGVPYVVAEASHAPKRADGPWARWHAASERVISAAALHLCFTARDAAGLTRLVAPERIVALPPFLASGPFVDARRHDAPARRSEQGSIRLVTAAMMRPGKLASYGILAEALAMLPGDRDWRLAVAGDGPERAAVEAAFAALPAGRIVWHGALSGEALAALFAASDLFVWPGFREPFGVAYLEAQAMGLPVLAMASGGVASVVEHGRTGLLVPEGDVPAYAAALERLAADPGLRRRLGREGARMIREERTLARAAEILNAALALALALAQAVSA